MLVHVLADITRHAGHADILRETVDGVADLRTRGDNLPSTDPAFWAAHVARRGRRARRRRATAPRTSPDGQRGDGSTVGLVAAPDRIQRSNSAGAMPSALQASRTAAFSCGSKLPSAPPMMMPTWITARAASGLPFSLPIVAIASTSPKS